MDITELRNKDKMLFHQSKMASIGEMLENIAHQWRQPLSSISTASTGVILEQEAGILGPKELIKNMNSINEAAQYLSTTIDYFREFLVNSNEKKTIMIKYTLEKTLGIVDSKFKSRDIKVISKIENIPYTCIESELIQVVMNILSNAQDALEKVDNKRIVFINVFQEKDEIFIVIKDSAGGIAKDILEKVFDPYFTTKHQSQGTGIGLYMSLDIVRSHFNGTIDVCNEDYIYEDIFYTGAKFTIKIKNSTNILKEIIYRTR